MTRRHRLRLWAEFLLLFVVTPAVVAVALPPRWMFPVLFAFTAVGIALLQFTPGFRWSSLLSGIGRISARRVLAVAVLTAVASVAVMAWRQPDGLFAILRTRPWLMLMIALFYPIVSALPQELVFRVLFFRRYGPILPGGRMAIWLNAAVFALAHLMYWSGIVIAFTFVGGLLFAWSYERRRNFPEAVVLHAVAGDILFAFGLGVYFYSGNVVRPF
ncbi:MAG: CPBP family intramembrane metalloprotease [Alphaproteobacteria bacterium]|nr:MAG: CPBP family intramembrane metalloprotease [Alphaproteobacteria bacterium]